MGFTNQPPILFIEAPGGLDATTSPAGGLLLTDDTIAVDPWIGGVTLAGDERTIVASVPFNPSTSPNGPTLKVTGNQTGIIYYDGRATTFANGGTTALYVVAIFGFLEEGVTVVLSGTGAAGGNLYSIIVAGDSSTDDNFRHAGNTDVVNYGGAQDAAQSVSSSGSTTLVAGAPAGFAYRLHTLAASAGAGLQVGLFTALSTIPLAVCANGDTKTLAGKLAIGPINAQAIGGSGSIDAYLSYDTVTLPTIS